MRRLVAVGVAVGSVAAGILWSKRRENGRRQEWVRQASVAADDIAEGVTRRAANAAVKVADVAEKAAEVADKAADATAEAAAQAGVTAESAARKAASVVDKAAKSTADAAAELAETAEKAADKASTAADKAALSTSEAAFEAAEKVQAAADEAAQELEAQEAAEASQDVAAEEPAPAAKKAPAAKEAPAGKKRKRREMDADVLKAAEAEQQKQAELNAALRQNLLVPRGLRGLVGVFSGATTLSAQSGPGNGRSDAPSSMLIVRWKMRRLLPASAVETSSTM